ncbi:HypC/HybG/HupF family hydrogenase formation chaperone [Gordonia sp. PP30]|uniref:HypC/HybG/HupF family hydrogenase formation chaperone n=1 Tax=Gordonia sp. PP30 TaxID=2935861 RepID=UPI001FFF4CDE|nr:HypC/HybG/HupF family hydrogenase formation chaperone [Gordonia sp. PP30]UQE76476.1 HypC/HybG/HupF family hydrogenase formation chaperone [Gordonia sp. PP30]
MARSMAAGADIYVAGAPSIGLADVHLVGREAAERALRDQVRPGDTIIVCGDFGSRPATRDRVLRRAPAWGVGAVWLGRGNPPEAGLALCIPTDDPSAALSDLIRGARELSADEATMAPSSVDCTDEVCVTCSDEGRLGEVIALSGGPYLPAVVRTADGVEEVDVMLVGDIAIGDLVLVHAGGAIARIVEPPVEENQ